MSLPEAAPAGSCELVALITIACGMLIGVSLGALGGGGSILTVPALVYLLGQSPHWLAAVLPARSSAGTRHLAEARRRGGQ